MTAFFAPSLRDAIAKKFSCKPRCCDWCNKRGLIANPLTRLYIESDRLDPQPEPYYWWVHDACATILLEDETITASLRLDS